LLRGQKNSKVQDWRHDKAEIELLVMFFRGMFDCRVTTIEEEEHRLTRCYGAYLYLRKMQ
jgi:hypothetical protein